MKTKTYDLLYKDIAQSGKSVLLHACCAPCASVCFEVLSAAGNSVSNKIADAAAGNSVTNKTAGAAAGNSVSNKIADAAAGNSVSNRITDAAAGNSVSNRITDVAAGNSAVSISNTTTKIAAGINTAAYFFNPNIMPRDEYDRRGAELEKLCVGFGAKLIVGQYNNGDFLEMVRGLEDIKEGGERCFLCYEMRLLETAAVAKERGFDYFATSLTLSPHKNAEMINAIGFKVAERIGVDYLPSNFKKGGGYLRSVELSREYGFYRQSYCGCVLQRHV